MTGKFLNMFLFLCAVVSVTLFAHFFISFESPDAFAQSNTDYVVAYLETPDIINASTVVSGQTSFVIRLAGTSAPLIDRISISLLSSTHATQQLHCLNATRDTEMRWRMHCDTLGVSNGLYRVQLSAAAGSVPAVLVTSTGLPAEFGPLAIQNEFTFTQPGSAIISGSVPISVEISGDVLSARVHIAQNGTGDTLELQRVGGEPQRSSVWQRSWDTLPFANGAYSIALTIQTLNGVTQERIITQTATVLNQTSCTPAWSCGDWTACTADGTRTRQCSDGCGTNSSESEPCTVPPNSADPNAPPSTALGISIIQPVSQSTVSESLALRAQVSGSAQSVTFFYRRPQSSIEYRIGNGNRNSADPAVWTQSWNTIDVPNGSYFIIARASDASGQSALSIPIGVAVYNQTATTPDGGDTTIPQAPSAESYTQPDTDGDGAADSEEAALGTDATTADTSTTSDPVIKEVFTSNPNDAASALNQLVSLGRITAAQADRIRERLNQSTFEQPTLSGAENSDVLRVHTIQNRIPETGKSQFIITGKGPAESYITLYIYSNPIVVTTKTDDQGNFEYTLDSDLLDGKHEVYVTVNDETGKIIEKSAPLTFFVRSAKAITEEEYFRGDVDVNTSGNQSITQYIRIVSITVLSLIAALGIGWLVRKKSKPPTP